MSFREKIDGLRSEMIDAIANKMSEMGVTTYEFEKHPDVPYAKKGCNIKAYYLMRVEYRNDVLGAVVASGSWRETFVPLTEFNVRLDDFYGLMKIAKYLLVE